jgi:hypothetical protein
MLVLVGVWRSLVAHLVWDQGVQGSNPCTPTNLPLISPPISFSSHLHVVHQCMPKCHHFVMSKSYIS